MKTQFTQEQISETAVRLGIPDHPFVARRIARAYDLVETNKVAFVTDDVYRVRSQYDPKAIYTVELDGGNPHCTCKDNERTIFCKHTIASMMDAFERQERKAKSLIVKKTASNEFTKASWVVIEDGKRYVSVWQDLNGKICCVCGAYYKRDCIHKQAIREYSDAGNGSAEGFAWRVRSHALSDNTAMRIENDCGTSEAKSIQDNLNGNNGTGDTQSPVHHQLDVTNPFEECEARDIDQINGNGWRVRRDDKPSRHALGDLVHVLSNREYVISYRGIMKLAEKHGVTFDQHTDEQEAKDTRTVIAYVRCGNNTRASGKPMNGSFEIAVALARRNACRQLLPLPEIKALEHKAKLEVEFDWQVAKRKCLEIVPDFKLDILIHDLVKAGTLRQAHPSDYNRKEWLVIFDAVKRDAETNGNDDDDNNGGGDNTPSSSQDYDGDITANRLAECRDAAKDFVRYSWLKDAMLKSGDWTDDDIAKLKEACEIDASLFGKELGHWTVEIQPNHGKWAYQRRWSFWLTPMSKRCFWCAETEGVMPDTFIKWGRYEIKASLCLECSQKVGKGELDKDAIVQKFDDLYHADPSEPKAGRKAFRRKASASHRAEVPDNADEFIAKCKQAEAEVEDTIEDVDDTPTNGDGKRKLQMDKKLNTWLIEADGTKKDFSCREICEQFDGNLVMRLRSGIDSGGDISTVELEN